MKKKVERNGKEGKMTHEKFPIENEWLLQMYYILNRVCVCIQKRFGIFNNNSFRVFHIINYSVCEFFFFHLCSFRQNNFHEFKQGAFRFFEHTNTQADKRPGMK